MDKVAYVKSQGQTRSHHCHWPGCERQVPPAMWGCKAHWFALPTSLRNRIWATYRPGQEVSMTPSAAYLDAANAVQAWIRSRAVLRAVPDPSSEASESLPGAATESPEQASPAPSA